MNLFIPPKICLNSIFLAKARISKSLLIILLNFIAHLVNSNDINKYTPIPKNPNLDKNAAFLGIYKSTINNPKIGNPNLPKYSNSFYFQISSGKVLN